MGMWWNWNGGWAAGMIVMMALVGCGVIALFVWLVARSTRHEPSGHAGDSNTPLGIARTRYAKGEITKDEYDRLKRDLSS